MAPAPLCKTAILSFIVDEALTRLWNVSSNMRKRVQMIVKEKQIRVTEYNEKALKINGWMRIGNRKPIKGMEEIKKGVFNYRLKTQEQVERVIFLNGKLRCYLLDFKPEVPLEVDLIERIRISQNNYDCLLKCSFKKITFLILDDLSSTQINQIISKFKQIDGIYIGNSSISNLSFNSSKIKKINFENITFLEKLDLPSNLDFLSINQCTDIRFLNIKRLKQAQFRQNDSFDLIKKCKGLKIASIDGKFSELINYLPSTTRKLNSDIKFDTENIDLANLKQKLPFLIEILCEVPIEIAQALNLRAIHPIIAETKEIFTFKPRQIFINDENAEQLNKYPELFEKVEIIKVKSNKFNFDSLPNGIKLIKFYSFPIEGEKFQNLEKNNWKFEKSTIVIYYPAKQSRIILNSLKKVKKIKIYGKLEDFMKDYPHFEFTLVSI